MRVLFAGSRGWHDPDPVNAILAGLVVLAEGRGEILEVVHGNAPGLDKLADRLAKQWGAKPIPVDAEWNKYGKGAGPVRNQKMLDEYDPEAAYLFRASGKSNGTDDMRDRAEDVIPTYVITGGVHPVD